MRLTLRTLLAYMDDRLKPADAKEIGDKIQQSEFASELVNRIGSVIRQRRLASPSAKGNVAPVDPNLLAEYLDDQLAPDIVEAIERRILTSDVCLAEIAASHQILAEPGDQAAIGAAFRDRLYGIGESAGVEQVKEAAPRKSRDEHAAVVAEGRVDSGNGEANKNAKASAATGTGGVPAAAETQSPAPWSAPEPQSSWKRWLPAAVVVAAGLMWIGLVVRNNPFDSSSADRQLAQSGEGVEGPDGQPSSNEEGDASAAEPESDSETASVQDDAAAGEAVNESVAGDQALADSDRSSGAGSVDAGAAAEAVPDDSASRVAAAAGDVAARPGMENDIPSADVTKPGGVPGNDQPVVAADEVIPGAPDPVTISMLNGDGILMLQRGQGDWKLSTEFGADLQPPGAAGAGREITLTRDDLLGVPEPFQLSVTIGESGWQGLVLGNSLVGVLSADVDRPAGLKLRQGRIRFMGDPTAVRDEDAGITLRIGAAGHSWLVSPASDDTVFGFEVRRPLSAGIGENPPAEGGLVAVYVAKGQIKMRDADAAADAEPLVLVQGQSRAIGTGSPAAAAIPISATTAIEVLPDWIYSDSILPDPTSAPASQFRRILEGDRSLVMGLLANVSDRNPQVASYCGQAIALLEEPVLLVECLLESEHEEVRRAAIQSVRAWLAEEPSRAEKLNELLLTRLPSAEVPPIVRLLQGFPMSAAGSKEISEQLLQAMEASRLLIRELAFYYVEQMTGQRRGYAADDESISRRKRSLQQWKRHVEQLGGRLAPTAVPDDLPAANTQPGDANDGDDGTVVPGNDPE